MPAFSLSRSAPLPHSPVRRRSHKVSRGPDRNSLRSNKGRSPPPAASPPVIYLLSAGPGRWGQNPHRPGPSLNKCQSPCRGGRLAKARWPRLRAAWAESTLHPSPAWADPTRAGPFSQLWGPGLPWAGSSSAPTARRDHIFRRNQEEHLIPASSGKYFYWATITKTRARRPHAHTRAEALIE